MTNKLKLKTLIAQILNESKKRPIVSEAIKNLNIEQPASNLYIKGWGSDSNGNMRIVVGFPNDKGFPIQTNGNLPETHNILTSGVKKLATSDLDVIGDEITDYVRQHGNVGVKSRLKVYKKQS